MAEKVCDLIKSGGGSGEKYSTSEVKTNDVWIDGKPIYCKVVDCGALPNTTTKNVAHGISNIDKLIAFTLVGYYSAGNNYVVIPYIGSDFAHSAGAYVTGTNVVIRTGTNLSASYPYSYSIIRYTKTTD